MDKNKDYYTILGVNHQSTNKEVKQSYYKLSFKFHPDKGGDPLIFKEITDAYNILMDVNQKEDYDLKSRFGKNYNEYFELFDIDINFDFKDEKDKLEKFKKNEVNNITIEVDNSFSGKIEYERWVKCKTCDGSGKDLSSKIVVRGDDGEIKGVFDADDGCDFCEGSGKDYSGDCSFCNGQGKVGLVPCKTCDGNKRILGKQKLSGINLTGRETKIDGSGHYSKDDVGKVGYLLLINTDIEIE